MQPDKMPFDKTIDVGDVFFSITYSVLDAGTIFQSFLLCILTSTTTIAEASTFDRFCYYFDDYHKDIRIACFCEERRGYRNEHF